HGFKEVKVRNSGEYFVEKYHRAGARGAYASRVASFVGSAPRYLMEILFILAVALLLVMSFVRDGGSSAVGTLALFVAAGFRLLPNLTGIMASISSIRVGTKALDDIHGELTAAHTTRPLGGSAGVSRAAFRRELRVEDVSYRYPD